MPRVLALILAFVLPAVAAAGDPIAGRWVGQWSSDANGHRGPLRATLTPTAHGYTATFTGRFALVVPFVYRTPLQVVGTSGRYLKGAACLCLA